MVCPTLVMVQREQEANYKGGANPDLFPPERKSKMSFLQFTLSKRAGEPSLTTIGTVPGEHLVPHLKEVLPSHRFLKPMTQFVSLYVIYFSKTLLTIVPSSSSILGRGKQLLFV